MLIETENRRTDGHVGIRDAGWITTPSGVLLTLQVGGDQSGTDIKVEFTDAELMEMLRLRMLRPNQHVSPQTFYDESGTPEWQWRDEQPGRRGETPGKRKARLDAENVRA